VRARVRLLDVHLQDGGRHLMRLHNTLEIEGQAKPALVAETLVLIVA
jgi:hypothetical protein